jgi:hypothetical protein
VCHNYKRLLIVLSEMCFPQLTHSTEYMNALYRPPTPPMSAIESSSKELFSLLITVLGIAICIIILQKTGPKKSGVFSIIFFMYTTQFLSPWSGSDKRASLGLPCELKGTWGQAVRWGKREWPPQYHPSRSIVKFSGRKMRPLGRDSGDNS